MGSKLTAFTNLMSHVQGYCYVNSTVCSIISTTVFSLFYKILMRVPKTTYFFIDSQKLFFYTSKLKTNI